VTGAVAHACAIAVSCAVAAVAAAGTNQRVASAPVPVYEQPRRGAEVVILAARGTQLELLGREDSWCWVSLPPDQFGTRRSGWLRCSALEDPQGAPPAALPARAHATSAPAPVASREVEVRIGGPRDAGVAGDDGVREAASAPRTANSSSPVRATGASLGAPPLPVGMVQAPKGNWLTTWFQPRLFRAAVGVGYESAQNGSPGAMADDRMLQGGLTLATSIAILDPRIATFDFAADLQTGRNNRGMPTSAYHNGHTLRSYRFDAGFLSGRNAPLRLFSDRVSSDTRVQPLGASMDPSQFTHGVRTTTGVSWDVNVPNRPRVQFSASTGNQTDERDYLFGYNSFNKERRAEVRLTHSAGFGKFDATYTYGRFVYDVPEASARSDTGDDLFNATAHLTPGSRLSLDLTGRMSRYRFGLTGQASRVTGAGADLAGRYLLSRKINLAGRYSYSSNAFEAIISGAIPVPDSRTSTITSPVPLATNTVFQDAEGRVEYGGPRASISAISRFTAYGVPAYLPLTLGGLRTLGALARVERNVAGWLFTGSLDGSAGTAASNRSQEEPYREVGVQAGASHDWSRFRVSADGGLRKIGRLSFYPVNLDSHSLIGSAETTAPAWARIRMAVTWSDNLRDILYNDNRDQHAGYTLSLTGRWYDVALDLNQLSARSLVLGADVLAGRPDAALLVTSRPDLTRSFLGASDRSRALSVQLRPRQGVQLNLRVVRQSQEYPGLFGLDLLQEGEQAWAVWQLRQLQLEMGWERLASSSSFSVVNGRRFYVRIRRDVSFF
jgi:hypothetical protein